MRLETILNAEVQKIREYVDFGSDIHTAILEGLPEGTMNGIPIPYFCVYLQTLGDFKGFCMSQIGLLI